MKNVSIREAAAILNIPEQFLRLCLQEGKFPFGVAVKRRRWSYYINRARLEAWLDEKSWKRGQAGQ